MVAAELCLTRIHRVAENCSIQTGEGLPSLADSGAKQKNRKLTVQASERSKLRIEALVELTTWFRSNASRKSKRALPGGPAAK